MRSRNQQITRFLISLRVNRHCPSIEIRNLIPATMIIVFVIYLFILHFYLFIYLFIYIVSFSLSFFLSFSLSFSLSLFLSFFHSFFLSLSILLNLYFLFLLKVLGLPCLGYDDLVYKGKPALIEYSSKAKSELSLEARLKEFAIHTG